MTTKRQISGFYAQGEDEALTYALDISNWPSSPSLAGDITVKVFNADTLADVTSTVTTGSPSIASDIITLPQIDSLTDGVVYRVEIKWTGADGDIYEAFGFLPAEK